MKDSKTSTDFIIDRGQRKFHQAGYMNTNNQRIAKMSFASVYPLYLAKVEKLSFNSHSIVIRLSFNGNSAVKQSMTTNDTQQMTLLR